MPETLHEFTWVVPADHPALAGHFPGNPIVPGVVLLDQALLFVEQCFPPVSESQRWRIDNAKFLSPVTPGETLTFALQPKPGGSIAITVHAGERSVASSRLTLTP